MRQFPGVSVEKKSEELVEKLMNCDPFRREWVIDDSYPLYKPGSCSLIDEQFNRFLNVTAVNHPYDALCALQEKAYDLVLSDVHMPNMNRFQLLQHINQEFRLPVILISSDSQAESKGIQSGALCFMRKPIAADDLKNIWQFSLYWKSKMNNTIPPIREINSRPQENVVRNNALSSDDIFDEITGKVVWSRNLNTRFVEALIILGYHEAEPRHILDVMNVPGLTRKQVASHLQKYRIIMQRILDGDTELNTSRWIDLSYYSSVVSGNPHLMLINQLRNEQRTGQLSAPIPASNMSSSSGGKRILPPLPRAEDSKRRNMNASSTVNVTAKGLLISTTLGNSCNANLGDIVESSTLYNPFQMSRYNQNAVMAPQNYSYSNGELVGGANNNMFSSTYEIGTSSTAPFDDNGHSKQAFNIGGQGSNNHFSGNDIIGDQLGIEQHDPDSSSSSGLNQFGDTSAVNEQQLGGGPQITAENSWLDDEIGSLLDNLPADLFDPRNMIRGEDDDRRDFTNPDATEVKDAVAADAVHYCGDDNDPNNSGANNLG